MSADLLATLAGDDVPDILSASDIDPMCSVGDDGRMPSLLSPLSSDSGLSDGQPVSPSSTTCSNDLKDNFVEVKTDSSEDETPVNLIFYLSEEQVVAPADVLSRTLNGGKYILVFSRNIQLLFFFILQHLFLSICH